MSQDCGSVTELPFDVLGWPTGYSVALMLDGVAIPEAGKQIYQWADDSEVDAECVYATTRWDQIAEISPWIVWLSGADDPVLAAFLENGAMQEHGYLIVTGVDRPDFMRWIRAHLQVEKGSGCEEIVRISHPALARSVIGDQLGQRPPSGVVRQLIIPDQISQRWQCIEPGKRVEGSTENNGYALVLSDELTQAFDAFNMRQASLQIWESLDARTRMDLGGPFLKQAFPRLHSILVSARDAGHQSPREMMRFLFSVLSGDTVTLADSGCTVFEDQG